MSPAYPVALKPDPKAVRSTKPTRNPFDTFFDGDGDESEDEWWDEEDSTISTIRKPMTTTRKTKWPIIAESTDPKTGPKPTRSSIRLPDKRHSVQKPSRDKSRGRVKKQTAKAGIKVVTNFSRLQKTPQAVQLQPARSMPQVGCFVDLAALQALNGESTQPSLGFWKKGKELGHTANTTASAFRNDPNLSDRKQSRSLGPSPLQPNHDLSPDDRPIVIGISIPSNNITDYALSPQTAISHPSKIRRDYEYRTPTNVTPDTPSIIVTSADGIASWSRLDIDSRAGAALSIYPESSQNTVGKTTQNAPPVSQMRAFHGETRQRIAAQRSYFSPDSEDGNSWEDEAEHASPSMSRVMSSCTIFEEDESPVIVNKGRAVSTSTRSARHGSISTVTTSRQSKGWWNYITTPFLTRSNTGATREVFDDQQPPALPSLAVAASKAKEVERDETSWEKKFSPLTPETTLTDRPESCWHSDSKDEHVNVMRSRQPSLVLHETKQKPQQSNVTPPFVLSEGAAIGVPTITGIAPGDADSQLDHTMTGALLIRGASGLSSGGFGVPLVTANPKSRQLQKNDLDMRPPLDNLSDSSNQIRSATRQFIRPTGAALVGAPSKPSPSPVNVPPPPYSPSSARIPRYRAILPTPENPPINPPSFQHPVSPGPLSPSMQEAMSRGGGIPLSTVPLILPNRRPINLDSGYPTKLPPRDRALPFTTEFLQPPKKAQKAEAKRRRHEREDAIAHRAGDLWRGRGCIPERGCYGRSGAEGRKRRRWYIGLITGFLIMIIVVIVLATALHRKSTTSIGPSQWLNLTSFPPIYTGLSTVAAPVNIVTDTSCVFPATQWSCDLPKELQASVIPNQPNQPNFLLDIQWDNSSSTNATFANITGNPHLLNKVANPVSAGQFIRRMLLKTRQIISFLPNPAPPSYAEEYFLGNTTDGIASAKKAGEPTPFYISFLQPTNSSTKTTRQILKRATDPFPNATDIIPAPSLNEDGTAAPANLLPFPSQQPIILYDRGLPSEHYGFYTYFDRSIFLKSITHLNNTNAANGEVPDDQNGGATEAEASFRCTWAQTRFLVQIWTRMNGTAQLNNHTTTGTTLTSPGTDFTQPGSFPYPITITTDRHGGSPALKMLYCYEMNDRDLVLGSGKINDEHRGFGGTVINPAPSVFANSSDPGLGGFDGGTGGCSCQWSNFGRVVNT